MRQALIRTIAFWIAPDGEIYQVQRSHIDYVIDHPELFQVDLQDLRALYADYNEDWRSEGRAREQVIRELVVKGWIRIRRYANEYSVNVAEMDEYYRAILCQFTLKLLNEGFNGQYEADVYMPLRIRELSNTAANDLLQSNCIELWSCVQGPLSLTE